MLSCAPLFQSASRAALSASSLSDIPSCPPQTHSEKAGTPWVNLVAVQGFEPPTPPPTPLTEFQRLPRKEPMNSGFSGESSGGALRHQLELMGEMLHRTGTASGNARHRVTRSRSRRAVP
jgi:hypothetical protein